MAYISLSNVFSASFRDDRARTFYAFIPPSSSCRRLLRPENDLPFFSVRDPLSVFFSILFSLLCPPPLSVLMTLLYSHHWLPFSSLNAAAQADYGKFLIAGYASVFGSCDFTGDFFFHLSIASTFSNPPPRFVRSSSFLLFLGSGLTCSSTFLLMFLRWASPPVQLKFPSLLS